MRQLQKISSRLAIELKCTSMTTLLAKMSSSCCISINRNACHEILPHSCQLFSVKMREIWSFQPFFQFCKSPPLQKFLFHFSKCGSLPQNAGELATMLPLHLTLNNTFDRNGNSLDFEHISFNRLPISISPFCQRYVCSLHTFAPKTESLTRHWQQSKILV